jgi:hypothetical protein
VQLQQQQQQQQLPQKANTEVFVFLVDAAVVQNAVASAASVASSPTPVFILASVGALSGVDVAAANLKAKLND